VADSSALCPNGHVKRCIRFGARRIDCENADDDEFCLKVSAVTSGSSGLVRLRTYDCPNRRKRMFRRHPHWWTLDGTYPPFDRAGVMPGPLLGPIY
jgi:hypothetical protein